LAADGDLPDRGLRPMVRVRRAGLALRAGASERDQVPTIVIRLRTLESDPSRRWAG